MSFDLSHFETRKYADEGVDFQLVSPKTGPVIGSDGKPVTFRIGGIDSPRIKAAVRERREARAKDRADAFNRGETPAFDPEQDAIEDLTIMTLGWSDNFSLDGKPCPFSKDAVRDIYTRFPSILEQMADKAGGRVNFMLASSKG
jgi:hypothetical protein